MKQGYTELTLDLLQKSPEAGTLLVQLHDKHKLYSLAKNRDPAARTELAEIMSDLLNLGLKPPENELVIDVLMSLMRQAEQDLKQAVSQKLATMHDVPLRLAVHLANEKIDIADPILRFCDSLNDMDLVYIVRSQTKDHWRAIAAREKMSDLLIDTLANTKDVDTAIVLSENRSVMLTYHAMSVFSELAENSEDLARPLLAREELPKKLATKLYRFVGEELKSYIQKHYDYAGTEEVLDAVDEIVFELVEAVNDEYTPTSRMIADAEKMMEKKLLKPDIMIDNLRAGRIANFTALFSVYCGLPTDTVMELLKQNTAQGLAVACKATGILKPEFVNIFLLTSRLRNGRVIDQKNLAQALSYYDKISEKVAQGILNQSRH
jgi:uncharacterized protein (DUF2336 family)